MNKLELAALTEGELATVRLLGRLDEIIESHALRLIDVEMELRGHGGIHLEAAHIAGVAMLRRLKLHRDAIARNQE